MSDIRFNRWLHQSGTGGVYQDSSGRVGIGTSVPTSTLDIVGTVNATTFSGTVNSVGVSTFTNGPVLIGSGTSTGTASQRLQVTGGAYFSGNIGVGTTNPDQIFTIQSGGDAQISLKNTSGTTKAYVGTSGAFGSGSTDDLRIRSDASNIIFGFSGTERMRLDSSGNLKLSSSGTSILNSSGRKILNQTGGILQIQSVNKTDEFFLSGTGTPTDVTGLSVSITPSSTSSTILVFGHCQMSATSAGGDSFVRLMRDSTAIGSGAGGYFGQVAGQDYYGVHSKTIFFLDSPATTSSVTYKMQVWGQSVYVNSRGLDGGFDTSSQIVLMEVAG